MRPTTNLAVLAAAVVTNQGGVTPQQQQHAAAVGDRAMMLATLMPTPRSLHDLWQEYEHGYQLCCFKTLLSFIGRCSTTAGASKLNFLTMSWTELINSYPFEEIEKDPRLGKNPKSFGLLIFL